MYDPSKIGPSTFWAWAAHRQNHAGGGSWPPCTPSVL